MLKCNGPDAWPYPTTTWYFNEDNALTDNSNGIDPCPNQYGDLVFPWADPTRHSGKYGCTVSAVNLLIKIGLALEIWCMY